MNDIADYNRLGGIPPDPLDHYAPDIEDDEDGERFYPDMSRKYMSAVESSNQVDVRSLCRVWDRWRTTGKLHNLLHGFLMISGLHTYDDAWREIDFLQEVLTAEADAAFAQREAA